VRPDAVRADRFKSVRDAAGAWQKAGVIPAEARARIAALYPDDRRRLHWALALLAGAATFAGATALVVSIMLGVSPRNDAVAGVFFAAFAVAFTYATELQTGRLRRANAGAELATAILAPCMATIAVLVAIDAAETGAICAVAAVGFAAGAFRWGFATLATLSSIFTLLALSRAPMGRLWWIAACLVAIGWAVPRARLERIAPAHRRCLRVVFAAALLGLYLAVHYDGVREGTLELGVGDSAWVAGSAILVVSAVVTALLPVVLLAFGIQRRDKVALAIGALLTGVSLGTWRYHLGWPPTWVTLTLGGVACFVTAILVRRFLDRAPEREWRGITADPLFDDPAHAAALRVAAMATTLGHAPQATADRPFQAGGGISGGGGADGQFRP